MGGGGGGGVPCHVSNIFSHVDKLHVAVDFKKWSCLLSNSRVKSPLPPNLEDGAPVLSLPPHTHTAKT